MLDKKKCVKATMAVGVSYMLLFSSNVAMANSSILKVGSRGAEVKELQQQMKDLGYYNYPEITGYYGTITKTAVINFQKKNGLTPDGIVGPNTYKKLNAILKNGNSSESNSRGSSNAGFVYTRLLKKGMKGSDVKSLQSILKTKGYYKQSIDGIFGSGTEKAVKDFQKSVGIKVDGIVGPATAAKLNGSSSSGSSGSKSGSNDNTNSRGDGQFVYTRLLKKGMKGSDVKSLQSILKTKGYYKQSIDGIFGSGTEKAVKDFQKSVGIKVDGIVGPATASKLNSSSQTSRGDSTGRSDSDKGNGEKKSVELISWDKVDKLFPRRTNARVTDVDTGKSFMIYRMGGTLHADVEPLTANDTAILKDIYGGKWSWDRRAVIVEVNGRLIAGSMNGMPHGDEHIVDNNFDGQFCIHFLGSKTHGSNKVDPDHQAAIQKAAQSR